MTRVRCVTLSLLVPADRSTSTRARRLLEIGRRLSLNERVAEVLTEAAERAEKRALARRNPDAGRQPFTKSY